MTGDQAGDPVTVGAAVQDLPFADFVAASSSRLFTMALLLCGHHRAEAEDLLQGVLERSYRRWAHICRAGDPERYVRRMLVNASVDRWRRLRRRREEPMRFPAGDLAGGYRPGGYQPGHYQPGHYQPGNDQAAAVDDRDLLLRALAMLPMRQRAVLVLRYLEDLSEAQTAEVLGCTEGTVKSQASRGLAKLRGITENDADPRLEAGAAGQAQAAAQVVTEQTVTEQI